MHQEVPHKNTKTKSIEILKALHPGQRNILLRKILENHVYIQLIKWAPSFGHR